MPNSIDWDSLDIDVSDIKDESLNWHDDLLEPLDSAFELPTVLDRQNSLFRDASPDEIISEASSEMFWHDFVSNCSDPPISESLSPSKSDSDSGNLSDTTSDPKSEDSPPVSPNYHAISNQDQIGRDGIIVAGFHPLQHQQQHQRINSITPVELDLTNNHISTTPIVNRIVIGDKVFELLDEKSATKTVLLSNYASNVTSQTNKAKKLPKLVTINPVNTSFVHTNIPNGKVPIRSSVNRKLVKPIKFAPKIANIQTQLDQLESNLLVQQQQQPQNRVAMANGGVVDLRALKKHQRMIKNRESANMSRKRKKEYVTSLENQLLQLANENTKLKAENASLHKMLNDFGVITTKSQIFNVPNAKKSTAFLLAMVMMISLNIHSFGNVFNKSYNTPESPLTAPAHNIHTRSLLWTDESAQTIIVNGTNATGLSTASNFNDFLDRVKVPREKTEPHMCAHAHHYVNQSESVRLATELRKWIGDNSNVNLDTNTYNNTLRVPKSIYGVTTRDQVNYRQKHTNYLPKRMNSATNTTFMRWFKRNSHKSNATIEKSTPNDMQVYSFAAKYGEYDEFLANIARNDDTFYLVSFTADHLLLPALTQNKTSRPKMSLLLPALTRNGSLSTNDSEHVTLLQIDCEVTNTNLVHVKHEAIPQHLRASLKRTATERVHVTPSEDVAKNKSASMARGSRNSVSDRDVSRNLSLSKREKFNGEKYYRPYFIKKYEKDND